MCGVAYEDDDDANEASKSEVKQKSAYKTRKDGDYEALAALIDECSTKAELRAMFNTHREKIEAMPDSWQKHLREHYARHIEGLAE